MFKYQKGYIFNGLTFVANREDIHNAKDELFVEATALLPMSWPPTNADRIRRMSDEELAEWMLKDISCDKEAHMCVPEMYKDSGKCNGNCRAGHLAYLRQPAKEE